MQERWSLQQAKELFDLPFCQLIYEAQSVHRKNFDPNVIQVSMLVSIKTGGCSEKCSYCAQSAHYNTSLKVEPLMSIHDVVEAAKAAKKSGATRLCMSSSGRGPRNSDLESVCKMIFEVKNLGLETCVTLGLLDDSQALKLKKAGLDFYNHNIDTSPEFYDKVVKSRTFEDRLETLMNVRRAGIKICCGGILGIGETNDDRIKMLLFLANLDEPPESVPINKLIKIPGTPLENSSDVDPFEFIKTIALARILMPKSHIRLSAGREEMSDEMQALCFMAGANSLFYGEKLLTANNSAPERDDFLFKRLGVKKMCL